MTKEDIIQDAVARYWNVRDDLKDWTLDQLKEYQQNDSLNYAVCAINITGDLNLGVMMRTACLMGAERFFIYGKHSYDRRTTVGAHNYIEIVKAGSIDRGGSLAVDYSEFFPLMDKYGYEPIFFETGGQPLRNFDPSYKDKKPCLVFGNEGIGIDKDLLKGQRVYSVEQRGVLRSLNVSAAASIAMHHVATYPKLW